MATQPDTTDLRLAVRQMCGYIFDDAKVARHHGVSLEYVRRVRSAIQGQKRKGAGQRCYGAKVRSHDASGIGQNVFGAEAQFNAMIREGSARLLRAIQCARGQMIG